MAITVNPTYNEAPIGSSELASFESIQLELEGMRLSLKNLQRPFPRFSLATEEQSKRGLIAKDGSVHYGELNGLNVWRDPS